MTFTPDNQDSDVELTSESGSGAESEWIDESETEETAQGPVYYDNAINWILTAHNHTMLNRFNKMMETIAEFRAIKVAQAKVDADRAILEIFDCAMKTFIDVGELRKRGEEEAAQEALKSEVEAVRSELGDEGVQMLERMFIGRARNAEDPVATRSES